MKGFIELTSRENRKILLNISSIESVFSAGDFTKAGTIIDADSIYTVKETYDEVKQKIVEAIEQKIGKPVAYPQPPYPVFPDNAPPDPFVYRDATIAGNITLKGE